MGNVETPDFRHLLLADLYGYFKSKGFSEEEAGARAVTLMTEIDKIAETFAPHD